MRTGVVVSLHIDNLDFFRVKISSSLFESQERMGFEGVCGRRGTRLIRPGKLFAVPNRYLLFIRSFVNQRTNVLRIESLFNIHYIRTDIHVIRHDVK
jgi:hypothetical protein